MNTSASSLRLNRFFIFMLGTGILLNAAFLPVPVFSLPELDVSGQKDIFISAPQDGSGVNSPGKKEVSGKTDVQNIADSQKNAAAQNDADIQEKTRSLKMSVSSVNGTPAFISSPNGTQLAAIFCTSESADGVQAAFSEDGGKTWPAEKVRRLSDVLAGSAHTVCYLPDGRIVASFLTRSDMESGTRVWKLWFGNYLDLQNGTDGIYTLRLADVPAGPVNRGKNDVTESLSLRLLEGGTLEAECACVFSRNSDSPVSASSSDTPSDSDSKIPSGPASIQSDALFFRTVRLSSGRISSYDWEAMKSVHYKVPEVEEGCEPTLTPPPEGAVVLFSGKSLDAFSGVENWTLGDGWMQVGKGSATTKQKFGSCRIHLEFATPAEVHGEGQARGNSGIYLMSRYELQIMDSYRNETYPQGQCGAIYTQNPPLKNVCRKPGEWQSYDVDFTAPKFAPDGTLLAPARVTVYQNGVLIQNDFEIIGRNYFLHRYLPHGETEPLLIQDHNCPVRFRNIWVLPK